MTLFEKMFVRGAYSLCFYTLQGAYSLCIIIEVLAIFINANKMIIGIQIGNQEIKIINFADDTTFFLRDVTCLDGIQVILKLYGDASSSKIHFSKVKPLQKSH